MITRDAIPELKPSGKPIPLETLRELPVPGVYVRAWPSRINDVILLRQWTDGDKYLFSLLGNYGRFTEELFGGESSRLTHLGFPPIHYPRLTRLHIAQQFEEALAKGKKTVTRRKAIPPGVAPGALVLCVVNPYCAPRGQGQMRGYVREVVSAEMVPARYRCRNCEGPAALIANPTDYQIRFDYRIKCSDDHCDWQGSTYARDLLTPPELDAEGWTGAGAEFEAVLEKMGAVNDAGLSARIEFRELP